MYLGLDFGTQSVKAVVVDKKNLAELHEASVNFDADLTEFRTCGGVNGDDTNSKVVTANPIMWIKALDILLEKLRLGGVVFEQIEGISGAAQQHGSVYWKRGARKMLQNMNPGHFLHEELAFAFSCAHSPVWMDSSTTSYCKSLEDGIGGPQELAKITGSRAYERFTGPQISKIFHTKPEAFAATERISLVSSFACSIFLGDYADIDYSDGSGMNLLDIEKKSWSLTCAHLLTDLKTDLIAKLGNPVPSTTIQGNISPYFVERFGFSQDCKILSFTGDNPSSFAAMQLCANDIAISLGTSDTLFFSLPTFPAVEFTEGHIFINPIHCDKYMALLCFKNGSLTRDRLRKLFTEESWDLFNELLDSTPIGNHGNIGFYYDLPEILPKVGGGDYRFNRDDEKVLRFPGVETEIRALIEGQFLARRVRAGRIGCRLSNGSTRILATGGASKNHRILQVLADVFNAPVYVQSSNNSADLGACRRLKLVLQCQSNSTPEPDTDSNGDETNNAFIQVCEPNPAGAKIYDAMMERYTILEDKILNQSN